MTRIRDTSRMQAVRDPKAPPNAVSKAFVAATFTATPMANVVGMDMLQVRDLMTHMIRSKGGRPSLVAATARVKLPKIAEDWTAIESISTKLAADLPFKPSPAQVAAVMLHWAVAHMPPQDIDHALRE